MGKIMSKLFLMSLVLFGILGLSKTTAFADDFSEVYIGTECVYMKGDSGLRKTKVGNVSLEMDHGNIIVNPIGKSGTKITIPAIYARGGNKVMLKATGNEMTTEPGKFTEINMEKYPLGTELGQFSVNVGGYSFYGDVKSQEVFSENGDNENSKPEFCIEGEYRKESNGDEVCGSTVNCNGTIRCTRFGISDTYALNIGTDSAPVRNAFEFVFEKAINYERIKENFEHNNKENGEIQEYFGLEIKQAKVNMVVSEKALAGAEYIDSYIDAREDPPVAVTDKYLQNFKLVWVQEEGEFNVKQILADPSASVKPVDRAAKTPDGESTSDIQYGETIFRVLSGGKVNFTTNGNDSINLAGIKYESSSYLKDGKMLVIDEQNGRFTDYVEIYNADTVGDFSSDKKKNYKLTKSAKNISLVSTNSAVWNMAIRSVAHGHFEIVVDENKTVGVKARKGDDYDFLFPTGTKIQFRLIPDSGYQYKAGTFSFNSDMNPPVKKTAEIGVYDYEMEEHNIYVSAEFEPAKNDIKEGAKELAGADISMGENKLPGSMEFSVNDASKVSDSTKTSIQKAAGDQEIGATLDLTLNQKINTVNNEKAWVNPVSELDKDMTVSLTLDDSLAGYSEYSVVRVHNGKTEKIAAKYDSTTKKLTFKTNKYSTYAIAHNKKADKANKITIKTTSYTKTASSKAQKISLKASATAGKIAYKSDNKKVTVSSTGKVTIAKNFSGKAVITITSKKTGYKTATKKVTITVNPAKVSLSKVTSPKKKNIKITWKKNAYVTGYEVQYSTDKNFAKKKTKSVTVKSAKTLNKTIGKLTSKKTYYVRVRTYKTQNKKNYYSGWSAKKSIKVK